MIRFWLNALLASLFLVACTSKLEDNKTTLLAKVNGDPIFLGDFLVGYQQLKSEQDDISQKNPKIIESLKSRALNEAIILTVVRQEAAKHQIRVSREQVESKLADWKDGYPPGGFEEMLKKQNTTEALLKQRIEDQLLIEKITGSLFTNETLVPDEEVKTYFKQHEKEFIEPEKVHVFQIVVPTKEEAEKIRQEITTGKISFESAARARSMSPDSSKGGDLGFFAKNEKIEAFNAAFSLSVNTISKPISSRFGVHLLKVVEKKPSKRLLFNEAKAEIVKKLKKEKEGTVYKEWLSKLLKDGEIYKNESVYNSIL
ncbi:MAG: peptidyl-prolyl cis-trans isomerase [Deltaproteobacteria bacterium]